MHGLVPIFIGKADRASPLYGCPLVINPRAYIQ